MTHTDLVLTALATPARERTIVDRLRRSGTPLGLKDVRTALTALVADGRVNEAKSANASTLYTQAEAEPVPGAPVFVLPTRCTQKYVTTTAQGIESPQRGVQFALALANRGWVESELVGRVFKFMTSPGVLDAVMAPEQVRLRDEASIAKYSHSINPEFRA